MKKKYILNIFKILLLFLLLTIIYFFVLKLVEIKHFTESGFVLGIIVIFCSILYGYLGYKYIRFAYPKRFDTKTQILIAVLCCLFGAVFTFFGMAQLLSFCLSSLVLSFIEVDEFHRDFGFAYPLLTGILSPAFAVFLYNTLLEKHIKSKIE
ncbi:MAG: hypothetical protein K1V97_02595 [Lachnospiraceae bacterium]